MNSSLDPLLEDIRDLGMLVADKVDQTKSKLTFELERGRAVFSPEVRKRYRAQARRVWRTLWESPISDALLGLVVG